MSAPQVIAVLGGTGREGSGLALRWAHAGYRVILGSRSAERGAAAAAELNALLPAAALPVTAAPLAEAAAAAAIVVLAVPYAVQADTAEAVRDGLAGKIVIDVTVPLVPPRVDRVQLPAGGSAVEALQRRLGSAVRVVSAFQNVSAVHLRDLGHPVACDVLVCADDAAAADIVAGLARSAGFTAWLAGPLANSVATEAFTSVLIALNRRYKVAASGLRITGLPGAAA